ncbi:MAG: thioredoxin domain-containing protein [Campylobacterota bacterium]|nr:thioredoxin domain-containing protein [Campylobacterota bacterium]
MKKYIFLIIIFNFLWAEHQFTNTLIHEDSPYLQQHAHNPVNWYPWGEEAFAKAKEENKLIFLSIGYSTCHWCHVMEEESFESEEVAALLNRDYVPIKVDREALPQIDKKYQQLFKFLNGRSGGWPLSVFLTSDQKPFYVTTYIPKEEGYGSRGMMNLLPYYADLSRQEPEKIMKLATAYEKIAKKGSSEQSQTVKFDQKIIEKILKEMEDHFDAQNGGFGKRPKFPEASKIALLLDIYRINGNQKALTMARETLVKMAQSGLYDQIDGGFFRYTTDRRWQIPHFEKMLYTNAELIPLYVQLYLVDPQPLFFKVVNETIGEMDRHLMQKGLYYSASDADSGGEEGGYFIYDYRNVMKELKERGFNETKIKKALAYLGIEEDGNLDGDFSHIHITSDQPPAEIDQIKSRLKTLRSSRTFPFVDRKIITAWNAMMVKAFFSAGRIEKRYIKEGEGRMKQLLALMSKEETLYHQVLFGKKPEQEGLLEDYAFMVDALIEAYQVTHKERYLHLAQSFAMKALSLFYCQGRWYLSSDGIGVIADTDDKYYTSPLSVMLSGLTSLAVLTEDLKLSEIVNKSLESYGAILANSPAEAPKFMTVFLRQEIGDIVIKSNSENLSKAEAKIVNIDYPFVLTKVQDSENYLACKLNSCFAESKALDELIKKIEVEKAMIGTKPAMKWK